MKPTLILMLSAATIVTIGTSHAAWLQANGQFSGDAILHTVKDDKDKNEKKKQAKKELKRAIEKANEKPAEPVQTAPAQKCGVLWGDYCTTP